MNTKSVITKLKSETNNIATWRRFFGIVAVIFTFCASINAQNVTISPSTGKLVSGYTNPNEVGYQNGWSSLWRHNQLPLTLTVSDHSDLTESGLLKDPAGDICLDTSQGLYILMGGKPVSTHINISLPKGFRFTGYRIVLLNNLNGKTVNNFALVGMSKTLYETDATFAYTNNSYKAKTNVMPATNDTKEYVIERTSKTATDMTNNLYFYFQRDNNAFYGATIKSCELFFTAEAPFEANLIPGAPTTAQVTGVNMIGSSFTTSKLDLGKIQPNSKNGVTYYSYSYLNVKDLTASNWLYQADAVTNGKLPETAGTGTIQALQNGDNYYYALGNNTYYIESPTSTKTQDNTVIPLGYRITGVKIKYHYGTAQSATTSTPYYITYTSNGTTYYLQTDLTWSSSNKIEWTRDNDGKTSSGNTYLRVNNNNNLTTTNKSNNASNFSLNSNGYLTNSNKYISFTDAASMASLGTGNPAMWTGTITNPAFTPSPYTLKVYGTDGSTPKQTVTVTSGDDVVTLTGLNNDAVKFSIEGLSPGSQALLTFTLTLEALNPFITSMDIVCTSKYDGQRIIQQFTSNDFQVSGGAFNFYVPAGFIGDAYNSAKFSFENLMSKYMDNTYGYGTNGNARNFFVKSAYYNNFGDGLQYTATGTEAASTKISTLQCGDKAFKYSNIDLLDPNNTSGATTTLEEYPYSQALYASQGGTFTTQIEIEKGQSKNCYLFTADETRYNIAPTTAMEHRYFAYYLMALTLNVRDYDAKCELTKLYDQTLISKDGQDVELPMYGGVFKAYDKETHAEIPSAQAYLTVDMMKQALIDALYGNETAGITGVGATGMQVLYLDYTHRYSVHVEDPAAMKAMKDLLNPNCLIYFPERTFYNEDNYIRETLSGDFRACRNIVITDKQPFYAPYKISVPAENYATYSREITVSQNGKVANATVILPFTLSLNNGVHTNEDGTSFSVNQMVADNSISVDHEIAGMPLNYAGHAHFAPAVGPSTEANVPYMVEVKNAPADDKVSFVATQYGTDVEATRGSSMDPTAYHFYGETAKGNINNTSYTFRNYGGYSGRKLSKTGNIFYFSGGMFLNSQNLRAGYDWVYVYPFRAYYNYEVSGGNSKLYSFVTSYDTSGETTGITEVSQKPDLAITAGQGTISFAAEKDAYARIVSLGGMNQGSVQLKAGESTTIQLPAGIYMVNGVKVIVK